MWVGLSWISSSPCRALSTNQRRKRSSVAVPEVLLRPSRGTSRPATGAPPGRAGTRPRSSSRRSAPVWTVPAAAAANSGPSSMRALRVERRAVGVAELVPDGKSGARAPGGGGRSAPRGSRGCRPRLVARPAAAPRPSGRPVRAPRCRPPRSRRAAELPAGGSARHDAGRRPGRPARVPWPAARRRGSVDRPSGPRHGGVDPAPGLARLAARRRARAPSAACSLIGSATSPPVLHDVAAAGRAGRRGRGSRARSRSRRSRSGRPCAGPVEHREGVHAHRPVAEPRARREPHAGHLDEGGALLGVEALVHVAAAPGLDRVDDLVEPVGGGSAARACAR